jgi:predicted phage tail protein
MKTVIRVDLPKDAIPTLEDCRALLAERDAVVQELQILEVEHEAREEEVEMLEGKIDKLNDLEIDSEDHKNQIEIQRKQSKTQQKLIEQLEAYIIRERGKLPGPAAMKQVHIKALTKILPDILAYAKSITRGTGSAANYEYQFRHAEHRAKLTKTVNVQAKKLMSKMIVTVGAIADRTANSVNPEDIHQLREELDHLTANHEIVEHTSVDAYLDGVMPELDPLTEADLARRMKR